MSFSENASRGGGDSASDSFFESSVKVSLDPVAVNLGQRLSAIA
jgi:hypothetical protein